jgi:hypothetical protein
MDPHWLGSRQIADKGSFPDALLPIRGRPALIRSHQSEIAVTEFKAGKP